MEKFDCSFDEYRRILKNIKKSRKYCDYLDAMSKDEFVVLRHDIEFSIKRAYELSLIETEQNICSSYFVQITNNSYNAFSKKNLDMLREMIKNGHHIGLHYHCNGDRNQKRVIAGIKTEIPILEKMLNINYKIDRFSMHRPSIESKYWDIEIPGVINTYSSHFFSFSENLESNLSVKYISDSKHRWNYGYPDLSTFSKHKKVQVLVHPFSWTEQGYDNEINFKTIIDEKSFGLMDTFSDEFQRYEECKEVIEKEYAGFKIISN